MVVLEINPVNCKIFAIGHLVNSDPQLLILATHSIDVRVVVPDLGLSLEGRQFDSFHDNQGHLWVLVQIQRSDSAALKFHLGVILLYFFDSLGVYCIVEILVELEKSPENVTGNH